MASKGNKALTVFVIVTFLLTLVNTALIAVFCFKDTAPLTAETQLEESQAYNAYGIQVANQCLRIGTFEVTETTQTGLHFDYELKNISDKDLEDIYVYYNVYDNADNFVGSSYTYIPHLDEKSSVTISDFAVGDNAKTVKIYRTFAVYTSDLY